MFSESAGSGPNHAKVNLTNLWYNLIGMTPASALLRRQIRQAWADPVRRVRTLESFAQTETDGGHDIAAAATQVRDPELLRHLKRHAEEELHHGLLFRQRAAELRVELGITRTDETELEKPFDLTMGHHHSHDAADVNAHGFLRASLFEDLGVISYVAMLHVAEKRAAVLFRHYLDAAGDDEKSYAIFDQILRDEKYHVAYTGSFLKTWRQQGKTHEVRSGLAMARGSRFLDAWKRAGIRAGGRFSKALLFVLYWTAVLPFAVVARGGVESGRWHAPEADPKNVQSQY